MIDKDIGPKEIERKIHDLARSMERIRSRQADRDDVVVDLRQARLSKLEILAENLKPVFDAVPAENEQFEFAFAKGETPRLWIDMTSYVRMGRDGSEFEFVKDTRSGRTILGRSADLETIGEHVSDYIAERVLERERALEGDWVSLKKSNPPEQEEHSASAQEEAEIASKSNANLSGYSTLKLALWFLVGLIVGGGLLLAIVWFGQMDWLVGIVSRLTV